MCLAVPVKVIDVDVEDALIDIGGIRRRVNISMIDTPTVGDYVLVHAGFAIQKWTEAEVAEHREILGELLEPQS